MEYHFDIDIATNHGVYEAIFLNNIYFWLMHNRANNKHFHEDRYWTYNSQKSFSELFPFWSRQNLRTIIKSCTDQGLLVKGNFNQSSYDQTIWYTLTDIGLNLFNSGRNQPMHMPKSTNESECGLAAISSTETRIPTHWLESTNQMVGTNQPIPDNKPYNKQKIKDKDKAQPKKPVACEEDLIVLPDWLPEELWKEFKQHRKEIKKPMTLLAQKKTIAQLDKMRANGQDITSVINQSIANGWQGIFELKSQGSGHGNNQQKSDWQIEYFKRELGDDFSGKTNSTQPKAAISPKVPEYLQERRRAEQSRYDMDTCFGDYFGSELFVGS